MKNRTKKVVLCLGLITGYATLWLLWLLLKPNSIFLGMHIGTWKVDTESSNSLETLSQSVLSIERGFQKILKNDLRREKTLEKLISTSKDVELRIEALERSNSLAESTDTNHSEILAKLNLVQKLSQRNRNNISVLKENVGMESKMRRSLSSDLNVMEKRVFAELRRHEVAIKPQGVGTKSRSKSSALCDLCKDTNFVFIISNGGRTGSTTLMDMLNQVPEVFISGENRGLLKVLSKAYNISLQLQSSVEHVYVHGFISEPELLCEVQNWIRTIIGVPPQVETPKIIGFKDLVKIFTGNSTHVDEENEISTIRFLKKAFPCAKFIVNYRQNYNRQYQFKWNKNVLLRKSASFLHRWANEDENDETAVVFPLERFSVAAFNELLKWIGITGCKYVNVCHSNQDWYYNYDPKNCSMQGDCQFEQFANYYADIF